MTDDLKQLIATDAGNLAAVMPVVDLQTARDRYGQIVAFVRSLMIEGTDFGTIPGTNKPTLLKPGAEKLTTFFGLSKRFEIVQRTEDWTGEDHNGEPFFYYLYRCRLFRGDLLIAEGDGSCNSMESKYRWRWVNDADLPPHLHPEGLMKRGGSLTEFTFAIEKAETLGQYGKPQEYWNAFKMAIADGTARATTKTTRSGKKYDAWEIDTTVYRIPNEDLPSLVNTIQKMAQKRAFISATLLAVNASEFFAQDLEDIADTPFVEVQAQPVTTRTDETLNAQPNGQPTKGKRRPSLTVAPGVNWAPKMKELLDEIGYFNSAGHLNNAAVIVLEEHGQKPVITGDNISDVVTWLIEYAQAKADAEAEVG